MTLRSLESIDLSKESRIAEYKSDNGIVFRAKLIGNVEVEEVRGKTVAENAMAKLKFGILKKRQHKTRININVKWDGFYVHLSEGGQELLHLFHLEQISFVWKDPTDDRAVGIIVTEASADRQTSAAKFFAYKTEKPAIPLIMSLKELFIFRTNDDSEAVVDPQEPKTESEIEIVKSAQDLLDLNFSSNKPNLFEAFPNDDSKEMLSSEWSTFTNNCQPTLSQAASPGMQVPKLMNNQSPWMTYPKASNMIQSPFNMSWPTYSCIETNASNPFVQRIEMPMPLPISYQNYAIQTNNTPNNHQPNTANHQTVDLFSDLIPPGSGLSSLEKLSANNNEKEAKRISLVEIKNSQIQKELKMDFSVLDNGKNQQPVMREKAPANKISVPFFQID